MKIYNYNNLGVSKIYILYYNYYASFLYIRSFYIYLRTCVHYGPQYLPFLKDPLCGTDVAQGITDTVEPTATYKFLRFVDSCNARSMLGTREKALYSTDAPI